jgi:hypothetical protein
VETVTAEWLHLSPAQLSLVQGFESLQDSNTHSQGDQRPLSQVFCAFAHPAKEQVDTKPSLQPPRTR